MSSFLTALLRTAGMSFGAGAMNTMSPATNFFDIRKLMKNPKIHLKPSD